MAFKINISKCQRKGKMPSKETTVSTVERIFFSQETNLWRPACVTECCINMAGKFQYLGALSRNTGCPIEQQRSQALQRFKSIKWIAVDPSTEVYENNVEWEWNRFCCFNLSLQSAVCSYCFGPHFACSTFLLGNTANISMSDFSSCFSQRFMVTAAAVMGGFIVHSP